MLIKICFHCGGDHGNNYVVINIITIIIILEFQAKEIQQIQ
jgi:hypothetical protein